MGYQSNRRTERMFELKSGLRVSAASRVSTADRKTVAQRHRCTLLKQFALVADFETQSEKGDLRCLGIRSMCVRCRCGFGFFEAASVEGESRSNSGNLATDALFDS